MEAKYQPPKPPYANLDVDKKYSWLKTPRWKGHAMEVGPLARILMLYASGHEPTRELATSALKQLDPKVVAERPLKLLCYEIVGPKTIRSQLEALDLLKTLG